MRCNRIRLRLQITLNAPCQLQFVLKVFATEVVGCSESDYRNGNQQCDRCNQADNQILPKALKRTCNSFE